MTNAEAAAHFAAKDPNGEAEIITVDEDIEHLDTHRLHIVDEGALRQACPSLPAEDHEYGLGVFIKR